MKPLAGEKGMTLVEVMVALVLLVLVLVPLLGVLTTSILVTDQAKETSIATALARQEMERLLAGEEPAGEMPPGFDLEVDISQFQAGSEYDLTGEMEQVTVRILWDKHGKEGQVSLTALRKGD